jgi:hypothetical protein
MIWPQHFRGDTYKERLRFRPPHRSPPAPPHAEHLRPDCRLAVSDEIPMKCRPLGIADKKTRLSTPLAGLAPTPWPQVGRLLPPPPGDCPLWGGPPERN